MMRRILSFAPSTLAFLALTSPTFAASANITGFEESQVPFTNLGRLLSNALAVIFFFAGLLAFVFIITGGIQWITAGGDIKAAQAARDRITAAVVGLIVVVAAFAITIILGQVFGINIFNFKFPTAPNSAGGG
jgi:hypothetical protein